MDVDEFSREIVLEHARHPLGNRLNDSFTHETTVSRDSCGDRIYLRVSWVADAVGVVRVKALSYSHVGCALSLASASMMVGVLEGLTAEETALCSTRFRSTFKFEDTTALEVGFPDLAALSAFTRVPLRQQCVLMAWNAFDLLQLGNTEQ